VFKRVTSVTDLAGAIDVEFHDAGRRDAGGDGSSDDGAGGGARDEREGLARRTPCRGLELGQSDSRDDAAYAATVDGQQVSSRHAFSFLLLSTAFPGR
jgi:hypothetical protein